MADVAATTVVHAKGLIDGTDTPPLSNAVVIIEGPKIKAVGREGELPLPQGPEVRSLDFPEGYLLPGLFDVHTHTIFSAASRNYEEDIDRDSDEILVLRAAQNANSHLKAGVTTLRDNGGRNKVTFNLRRAAEMGLVETPRLLLCGRPVTVTGGHFWWCNEEADGVDGVRKAVRRLIKDGADHIKIMASGGGTLTTNNRYRSFSTDELKAIVDEAHNRGKLTTAHAAATEGMRRALEAGVDMMEHALFVEPDDTYLFDPSIAERIAQQGTFICPTVQTGYRARQSLLERAEKGPLTSEEHKSLDALQYKYECQVSALSRFWKEWGIPIVFGTDAPPSGLDSSRSFGTYPIGLELQLMAEAGMRSMDIIRAATSVAAGAVGIGDLVGTIEAGKEADIIAVNGDPIQDILALKELGMVMKAGKVVG